MRRRRKTACIQRVSHLFVLGPMHLQPPASPLPFALPWNGLVDANGNGRRMRMAKVPRLPCPRGRALTLATSEDFPEPLLRSRKCPTSLLILSDEPQNYQIIHGPGVPRLAPATKKPALSHGQSPSRALAPPSLELKCKPAAFPPACLRVRHGQEPVQRTYLLHRLP
jgi:hypothetical protein